MLIKQNGQSITEYMVVVSLVAMVSIPAVTMLGKAISQKANKIAITVNASQLGPDKVNKSEEDFSRTPSIFSTLDSWVPFLSNTGVSLKDAHDLTRTIGEILTEPADLNRDFEFIETVAGILNPAALVVNTAGTTHDWFIGNTIDYMEEIGVFTPNEAQVRREAYLTGSKPGEYFDDRLNEIESEFSENYLRPALEKVVDVDEYRKYLKELLGRQ